MPVTSYAIALGSNRRHGRHGAPARVIAAAVAALAEAGIAVAALSPVLRTVAMGPAGRDFANAAAIVTTELDPPALADHVDHASLAHALSAIDGLVPDPLTKLERALAILARD